MKFLLKFYKINLKNNYNMNSFKMFMILLIGHLNKII